MKKMENFMKEEADDTFKERFFGLLWTFVFGTLINFMFFFFLYHDIYLSLNHSIILIFFADILFGIIVFLEKIKRISKIAFILKYLFYFLMLGLFFFLFSYFYILDIRKI